MLKKIGLLTRLDLKVLLNSPWTYFLLLACAVNVTVFLFAQPDNRNTRIIVVDEIQNSQTEKIVQVLLDEDYVVERKDQIGPAFEELKRQNALAIFHIDKNGNMAWLTAGLGPIIATPGSSKRMKKMLSYIVDSRKFDIEKSIAQNEKLTVWDISVVKDDLSRGRSIREESTAYIGMWMIWFICAVWSLILLVNLRDSYFKLARKYTAFEIFSSKIVSGLVFGAVLSTICWVTCVIIGVRHFNILALVYCSFWAALLGVLSGMLAAVIPLSFKADTTGMVLMGMMMIFAFFSITVDGCAPFMSMSLMPESTQKGALWNYLFLLDTLTRISIFSKGGFFTLHAKLLTRQLAFISAFEALGCFIFLNKR